MIIKELVFQRGCIPSTRSVYPSSFNQTFMPKIMHAMYFCHAINHNSDDYNNVDDDHNDDDDDKNNGLYS